MKLVLKERKILKENVSSEPRTSWKVATSPANFLALAKEDTTGNVQSRADAYGQFDPKKAGSMVLVIDPTYGKIMSHDGRARAQTALNSGVEKIELTLKIDTEKESRDFSWDKLPTYFLPEDGREGYVSKSAFELKAEPSEANFEDILRLGGTDKVFHYEVVQNPRGPYVKQDPNKDAPTWIGARYSEYFTPMLRKSAGLPEKAGELPIPILEANKQYRDLINKQYKFTDEQGELKIVQNNPPFGTTLKFDRQAVGNVTMSAR
jgi:hypothetical protein